MASLHHSPDKEKLIQQTLVHTNFLLLQRLFVCFSFLQRRHNSQLRNPRSKVKHQAQYKLSVLKTRNRIRKIWVRQNIHVKEAKLRFCLDDGRIVGKWLDLLLILALPWEFASDMTAVKVQIYLCGAFKNNLGWPKPFTPKKQINKRAENEVESHERKEPWC